MRDQSRHGSGARPQVPAQFAAPVRESLRGLRDVLHFGRDVVHGAVDHAPLPRPVSRFARSVLSEVDRVAERVEGVATELVREMLGPGGSGAKSIVMVQEPDRRFAAAMGPAIHGALREMGISDVVPDEGAIASLNAALRGTVGEDREVERAAILVQAIHREALRSTVQNGGGARLVAVFAAMLWFLSDREQDREALEASVDLAMALEAEIRAARSDTSRLAALLGEFRDHV